MNNIVKESFYITSLFADIKSDTKWTEYEIKTVLMLFAELSKYRVYIPDFYEDKKKKIIDESKIYQSINKVPREYLFLKEEFREKTSIDKSHLAREINKVRKSLVKKTINTPHPIYPEDINSGETISWFSKITYNNKTGEILIKVNEDAIDRLVALVNYTKIDFSKIIAIKNANSIFYYMFFKIIIDSSNQRAIELSLKEFKEKINLSGKYVKISHLKEKVLEVIKNDINAITDINLDYELIKTGRSFSKIIFKFDYKPEYINQKKIDKSKVVKTIDMGKNKYFFESILVDWGIKPEEARNIELTHAIDVIESAINKTLEKEKSGEIKKTKAAIFLGILKNKQNASDEIFERKQNELLEEQEKKEKQTISQEYDKLRSYILANEDVIKSSLTIHTKMFPITDKEAISVINKLKKIDVDKFRGFTTPVLDFYHFQANKHPMYDLSGIIDWINHIEINSYDNDFDIVKDYQKAVEKIKEVDYLTDNQKHALKKEAQDTINILLGF